MESSNTFGDGTLGPLNSTFIPNLETAEGELDVDWFTDISASGQDVFAPFRYGMGKLAWTALRLQLGIAIGNHLPFIDPGERNAVRLAMLGYSFKSIFNDAFMARACPGQ